MKQFLVILLIGLALAGLACKESSTDPQEPTQTGDVSISFAKSPAGIALITATITRASYETQSLTLTVSDSGTSATGTFHGLASGTWHLKVNAFDDSSIVRYSGEKDVDVIGGKSTVAQLTLLPLTGDLEIVVTWAGIDTSVAVDNLRLHLTFDGTLADASGNGNTATSAQALYTADHLGQAGKAFRFNGSNNFVSVANNATLNPTSQVSIAMWMRVDSIQSNYMPLFMKGGPADGGYTNRSYGVLLKANGPDCYPQFKSAGDGGGQHELTDIGDGSLSDPFFFPGQWQFLVFEVDRVNHRMQVYVNGSLALQNTDSYSTINSNAYPLIIGSSDEGLVQTGPFKGAIDDFRIYGKALSSAEVQALYGASQ